MMTESKTKTVKLSDTINGVTSFFQYAMRNIRLILSVVAFAVVAAVGYYFFQKPTYEGMVTFILEEKSSGGGGISGLASQFGIDIGSLSGNSGMFAGDNILDILKSKSIIEKVLLSKVDSAKGANSATMVDLYLDFSGLKNKWKNKTKDLAGISYANLSDGAPRTLVQDSVLSLVVDKIIKKNVAAERLNKKGSIIKVTTVSVNQVFSKLFSDRLLTETRKLYVEVKTGISSANVARLQHRADSLLRVLNAKSYQSASTQIVDANIAFKSATVPGEVTQRDKMVNYAIYTEVMKNLEASRMSLANQTPAIQLLDDSRYPLEDQRKSFGLVLGIGFLAGIVLSLVFLVFTYSDERVEQV